MATAASESVQRSRGAHLYSLTGLWLAVLIVVAWLVSLLLLLQADLAGVVQTGLTAAEQLAHWQMPSTWFKAAEVGAEILLRTFLQTGLFIVAHDAMHGSLIPAQPRWNHRLGRVALILYACLPYGDCYRKHLQHHRCPGGSSDPDFHNGVNAHPTGWYLHFMRGYLSAPQICGLAAAWICMAALMASTTATIALNIAVFWVVPLVLSSMQLFLFGTYLPHRPGQAGDEAAHKVKSLPLPALISLLSCYHFGLHWEHHEHPDAAWFELPSVHDRRWRGDHNCIVTG